MKKLGLKTSNWIVVAFFAALLFTFTSCENDDEIGLDISGMYGKTWKGIWGHKDKNGNDLYNEVSFNSGANTVHGIGYDKVYDTDGVPYDIDGIHPDGIYKFDWNVTTGIIVLKYEKAYFEDRDNTISIYEPKINNASFSGKINGKIWFELKLAAE